MSCPKFLSPANSQSEMLGHVLTMEESLGHENDGKGGVDQNGSLCGKQERESV